MFSPTTLAIVDLNLVAIIIFLLSVVKLPDKIMINAKNDRLSAIDYTIYHIK